LGKIAVFSAFEATTLVSICLLVKGRSRLLYAIALTLFVAWSLFSGINRLFCTFYGDLIHPSGEFLDTEQINSYNFYDGTQDCIANAPGAGNPCGSGQFATAYLAMVPFESTDNLSLSSTAGANANSKVVCVLCQFITNSKNRPLLFRT